MNITQKLHLQSQLGGLVLFKEGVFLRAYNESCYMLTQLLGHKLAIQCKQLKCLNGDWVVMCVFPADKLVQRLPDAKLNSFGAHLPSDFDLSDYHVWFKQTCRPANGVSRAKFSRHKEAQASAERENFSLFFYTVI